MTGLFYDILGRKKCNICCPIAKQNKIEGNEYSGKEKRQILAIKEFALKNFLEIFLLRRFLSATKVDKDSV